MAAMHYSVIIQSTLLAFFVCSSSVAGLPCKPLALDGNHIVCVCNSTYCDDLPDPAKVPTSQFIVYTSTADGKRFEKTISSTQNSSQHADAVYFVNHDAKMQTIKGFGGAFTDAAGINIVSLPAAAQDKLITTYYGVGGIGYTIGRVPMASCDFSTHAYSYDDSAGDFNLTKFALAPEDLKYKIPLIQSAMKKCPSPIKMFASPWSPPAWMKTNGNMTGKGSIKGAPGQVYYKSWAQYFVRFLQEYQSHNISFWGLTVENEPMNGFIPNFRFQCLGLSPENERDFVKLDLGPALHNAGFENVQLMMFDDQRLTLPEYAEVILADPDASKYIAGIAVHWYMDEFIPANVLSLIHDKFPDKFLFASEACEGSNPWEIKVDLGSWDRARTYAHDIIADLNNWVTGWTDWNLALSPTGGPNWVSNFVDSPIIVDSKKQEFYKQPMFYAMGHFSKFFTPGSQLIRMVKLIDDPDVEVTGVLRPDNSVAVVIHNLGQNTATVALKTEKFGYIQIEAPGNSLQTVLYWLS